MATIEHRGPNTWRVGVRTSVEEGRKWIRQTISFPAGMPEHEQRRRAELAAAQLTLDVDAGKAVPSYNMTVRGFSEMWIDEHVRPNCKPTTLKNYQYFLDSRILPALGDIKLQSLTIVTINRWLNSLKEECAKSSAIPADQRKRKSDRERPDMPMRPLSDRTITHYYDCLNYMLNKAVEWKMLSGAFPYSEYAAMDVQCHIFGTMDIARPVFQ